MRILPCPHPLTTASVTVQLLMVPLPPDLSPWTSVAVRPLMAPLTPTSHHDIFNCASAGWLVLL